MRLRFALVLLATFIVATAAEVRFKQNSLLASGKWVKLKATESGIYEISYAELSKYGFSNPKSVRVYANGGNMIDENYFRDHIDDLEQTPVMHKNSKIYFYTKGMMRDSLVVNEGDMSRIFYPIPNSYSTHGAIFLTDSDAEEPLLVADLPSDEGAVDEWCSTGIAVWYDKKSLYNPGLTGRKFLGDNILSNKSITYNIPLPELAHGGKIDVNDNLALMGDALMEQTFVLNGRNMGMYSGNALGSNYGQSYVEYGNLNSRAWLFSDNAFTDNGTVDLTISLKCDGTISRAWVDYVALTYPSNLTLPDNTPQMRHFAYANAATGLRFTNVAADNRHVWIVNEYCADGTRPFATRNLSFVDVDGDSGFFFNKTNKWEEFIVFDTDMEQLKPEYIGPVDNQNLHACTTPDMVIITNADLHQQAERLADFHRQNHGMDVLVVDQNDIFNEFSGGIRDVMGYRLFCKMLYDRGPEKLKYLLLFGGGTYDNRMLFSGSNVDRLLTFQSEISNSQKTSYCTDDFFGYLDDNTNNYMLRQLNIAVGRIPVETGAEAKAYVDKLIKYMSAQPDADSDLLNNFMVIGEDGDSSYHVEQCESFIRYLNASGRYAVNTNKLYREIYDADAMNPRFVQYLKQGQNFGLFVGHGTWHSLTHEQKICDIGSEQETYYEHPPVFYFSSCDVGRYDNGGANMATNMMLNQHGGIIAAIASSRVAMIAINGMDSNSFAKSLAKGPQYYGGRMTVGAVLRDAKNNSGDYSDNRLRYHLLGDPAMPIVLPENRMEITKINQSLLDNFDNIYIAAEERFTINGCVRTIDGLIDTDFNGTATLKLYDADKYIMQSYESIVGESGNTTRLPIDVYDRGPKLVEISAKVVDGTFSTTMAVPAFVTAGNLEHLPITMTAVSDQGTVVSGTTRKLTIDRGARVEFEDNVPPTITELYIDDKDTFVDGGQVPSSFVLHAEVSDNRCLNVADEAFVTSLSVQFDGGKTSAQIENFTPTSEAAGTADLRVYNMAAGYHTAELTATDMSGNVARRMISFYVYDTDKYILDVDSNVAAPDDSITFDVTGFGGYTSARLCIVDKAGNVVLQRNVSAFPYVWDLTLDDGNKIPAGDYSAYAVVDSTGTKYKKIVVLKQ
ncbi:MAG: type IX secretion system sortase PorU [Candidatus Limisoma sp.]